MNNNQTVEKLRRMRLNAMAELHLNQMKSNHLSNLTPDEYLALLTDHEWEVRQNQKIGRLVKSAGFRQKADTSEINFGLARNLDKNMFNRLVTLDFMKRSEKYYYYRSLGCWKEFFIAGHWQQSLFRWIESFVFKHRPALYPTKNIESRWNLHQRATETSKDRSSDFR